MDLDLSIITEFLTVEFLVSALFISIGSFLVFDNWWSYKIAKQTVSWPKTTGTILKSQVKESWHSRKGGTRREWAYDPNIY